MTKHTTRIVWLLPFMAMVPVGLAHCSGDDTVAPGGGKKADASTVSGEATVRWRPRGGRFRRVFPR